MFSLYHIPYTINDLQEKKKLEIENTSDLRKKAKIIVVDDQNFPSLESLRDSYHYDIKQVFDMDDAYMAAEYDIILCDIQGVASKLNSRNGGANLIKEIKLKYPTKKVVAYSAMSFKPSISDLLDYADKRMGKSSQTDDWVNVLDNLIKKKFDLREQWFITRNALLKRGLSIIDVAKIESNYVNSVNNNCINKMQNRILKENFDGKEIVVYLLKITANVLPFLIEMGVL